jgi:hypothetical protein
MDSSSGHILWSWHIWVTPHAYDASNNNLTYYDPNTLAGSIGVQKMLVRPLGFIEGDWKTYAERTSTLTLTQDTSGKTCTVNLVQKYHQFQSNSCCYYQWGRKDPFPGCDNVETGVMNYYGDYTITSTPRPIYDINGNTVSITHSSADRTLYNCINNPSTFYTTASEGSCRIPTGRNYYNLWGCTFSSSDIEDGQLVSKLNVSWGLAGVSGARKTVYDPCPPGYRVPPILYMPAVTYDGWNHGTATNKWVASANTEADLYKNVVNTSYSNHDQVINSGYFDLYESKMTAYGAKPGGNSYRLYAMGYKATDGNFQGYGGLARYWSASSWAASTGTTNHRVFQIYFYYGSGTTDFHAVDGNTEYYGNPVMAMCDPAMPCW